MLIGNLTRDPNLRFTPSGTAVCSFGLATNRSWTSSDSGDKQQRTDFHNIVSWSKLAEICDQLLNKGDKVYVEGRVQTRDWKTDEGEDRRITEVVIDNMILLASPRGSNDSDNYDKQEDSKSTKKSSKKKKQVSKSKKDKDKDEEVSAEDIADDIPF